MQNQFQIHYWSKFERQEMINLLEDIMYKRIYSWFGIENDVLNKTQKALFIKGKKDTQTALKLRNLIFFRRNLSVKRWAKNQRYL